MKHPQFYVHQICLQLQAMLLSSLPLDPHYPHHPLDPTVLKPHHPWTPTIPRVSFTAEVEFEFIT